MAMDITLHLLDEVEHEVVIAKSETLHKDNVEGNPEMQVGDPIDGVD